MRNLNRSVLALLAVPLGSCAITSRNAEPLLPAGHHFSYRVPLREEVNLIQVFDDGATTYFQFTEAPDAAVELRRLPDNEPLSYTVDANFLKVQGIYDALRVTVAGRSTAVINDSEPRSSSAAAGTARSMSATSPKEEAAMSATPAQAVTTVPSGKVLRSAIAAPIARRIEAAPVGVPESLQTMHPSLRVSALKQEIATLEERVRALTAELEEAHRTGAAANLFLRRVGGAPRVVLTFEDNSFETRVDENLLDVLGEAARAANRIYLHGHTDAYVASQSGTELAIRRAVEVRKLLLSRDVEPERIRLFYRGAGNFVANNSTPEGKALNRRVEIELRKW
jgi:outer membrane protein OmpA-like peptidoglycan-associated protein